MKAGRRRTVTITETETETVLVLKMKSARRHWYPKFAAEEVVTPKDATGLIPNVPEETPVLKDAADEYLFLIVFPPG